ncbi:MAG: S8 family serine peptidase, partial [Candidatus Bathyarchaeia archaeon]
MLRSTILALAFILMLVNPVFVTAQNNDEVTLESTFPINAGDGLPIKPTANAKEADRRAIIEKMIDRIIDRKEASYNVILGYDAEFHELSSGLAIHKKYRVFPLLAAEGTASQIRQLSESPGIIAVYPDRKVELTRVELKDLGFTSTQNVKAGVEYPFVGKFPTFLNETTELIGAQSLWAQNITGNDVVVAIIDTGVNQKHPSLDDLDDTLSTDDPKVIKEKSFVPDEDGADFLGHGTLVASIAAGTGPAGSRGFVSGFFGSFVNATILPGTQGGVAPNAKVLNVKVFSRAGFGMTSWVLSGMEWAMENGADVINMSLGAPDIDPEDPLGIAVAEATRRGIVVVTSAGNNGPGRFSVSSPGSAPDSIAVGLAYKTGSINYFSGRGPTAFNLISKPDVVAPGAAIVAANPFFEQFEDTFYLSGWGTSFSAPHATGAVALLLQAFPGASPHAIRAALMGSAKDLGMEPSIQGAGLIDVARAYELLKSAPSLENEIEPPKKIVDPQPPAELAGTRILYTGDMGNFTDFFSKLTDLGANVTLGGPRSEEKTFSLNAPSLDDSPRTSVNQIIGGDIKRVKVVATGVFDDYIEQFYVAILDVQGQWQVLVNRTDRVGFNFMFQEDDLEARAVHIIVTEFDAGGNPAGFSVQVELELRPMTPEGFPLWIVAQPTNQTEFPSISREAREHVLSGETSMLFLGDQLASKYTPITSNFGISWTALGIAIGGTASRIVPHPATDGVDSVFFGGPLSSLEITGEGAETIVFAGLPAVAVWTDSSGGRVAVVSDDDVLNNRFLTASENFRLGVNLVKWLSEPSVSTGENHDVSLGIEFGSYFTNALKPRIQLQVTNFGDFTEEVSLALTISDQDDTEVFTHNETITLDSASTVTRDVKPELPIEDEFATFNLEATSKISQPELDADNNKVTGTMTFINKITRAGPNPILTHIAPQKITSFTGPHLAMYPGDFNVLNMTIISSGEIVDGNLVISDGLAELVTFSNAEKLAEHGVVEIQGFTLFEPTPFAFRHGSEFAESERIELGNFLGTAHAPIQIDIPITAERREYSGTITLLNGTLTVDKIPVNISVKEPNAKILYDDIFDTFDARQGVYLDAERLWGGLNFVFPSPDVADWWRILAKAGYDVDSVRQVLFDDQPAARVAPGIYGAGSLTVPESGRFADDPWAVFLNAKRLGYNTIIIHDKEMHNFETAAWPKVLASGVNLITNFDSDFPGFFPTGEAELFPERIVNWAVIKNFNSSHPVVRGLQNATFLSGITLATSEDAQILFTGVDTGLGPSTSGVLGAAVKNSLGTKQVAFGDSNLFDFVGAQDFSWVLFQVLFNVTIGKTSAELLVAKVADYATNLPPEITLQTGSLQVAPGETLRLTVLSSKPSNITVDLLGREMGIIDSKQIQAKSSRTAVNFNLPAQTMLGEYAVAAIATDAFDDSNIAFTEFLVVDKTPPRLTIVQPKQATDLEGLEIVAFWTPEDDESGISSSQIRIDEGPWQNVGASQSFPLSELSESDHRLAVRVVNGEGLESERTVMFS